MDHASEQPVRVPDNEVDRLHALLDYQILDTPHEGEFDHCARLIAQICDTPIGAVTLIDHDRAWVKAVCGPLPRTMPRRDAFCARTMLEDGAFEVHDTLKDARFATTSIVTSAPFVRYYAGVALTARNGLALGTICVMDVRPRELTPLQQKALEIAAAYIAAQLEVRLGVLQLVEQRQLAASQSEAMERASQRQKDLSALLIHDLRTPLASMSVNGRYLADHATLSVDQQAALQDMLHAGEHLAGLVHDLLQVGRAEDGQLMVRRKAHVDLADVAREAMQSVRAIAAERGLDIELDAGPDSAVVDGDKDLLLRVVTNLLENALRFSPARSVVRVELAALRSAAVLRVVDQGPGIAPALRTQVFDKYFQVDQSSSVRPNFGLGLSFCKLAVEAHGGAIDVEDVPQGCSFRVTLPLPGAAPIAQVEAERGPIVDGQRTTDDSLSTERSQTDKELDATHVLAQRRADSVVVVARTAADDVLSEARAREDARLDRSVASSSALQVVAAERAQADVLVDAERGAADRKLADERETLKRSVYELIANVREDTDVDLSTERKGTLQHARSSEHALEELRGRLDDQSRAVEEAIGTRDSFLSMASHELRTPLAALQLHVQGLLREAYGAQSAMPPGMERRLAVAAKQVDRLEALVRRLLDVSLLSTDRLDQTAEQADLSAIVVDVAQRSASLAQDAGCTLTVEAAPGVVGRWDRGWLERIVTNLLINALKYGRGAPVVLRLEDDGAIVRLQVQDGGIGIAAIDHARIFGRHERAVSDDNYAGLGLGLWIVKQIVDGMGGTVSVTSELGAGATFTVELPKRA